MSLFNKITENDDLLNDIGDDEIRFIGEEPKSELPVESTYAEAPHRFRWVKWVAGIVVGVVVGLLLLLFSMRFYDAPVDEDMAEEVYYYQEYLVLPDAGVAASPFGTDVCDEAAGYTEIRDTMINDIPLKIYLPHNAAPSLHVGPIPYEKDIVLIAQAADVRADNGGIVSAFVLNGELLSRGRAKAGYCAIVRGEMSLGVAGSTPLLEEAIQDSGYFFRQRPLVNNNRMVKVGIKNKSYRKALCERAGEYMIIESLTRESFHDFSQALADLKVSTAISLVGSTSYGYAVDISGKMIEFGKGVANPPHNVSYILWRK